VNIAPIYPAFGVGRGPGFWLNPRNLLASRRKGRRDESVLWRRRIESENPSPGDRSTDVRALLYPGRPPLEQALRSFSFVVLGDTGEGDRSQYATLPLIRALNPDFLIINGDLAYPAGRVEDFIQGFFEPYQGLHRPIWAVPGNHEYYSPNNGREFYDIFCTRKFEALWQQYGLSFVKQPGTYWELAAPDLPFAVIALDSGMKGHFDPGGEGDYGDPEQLDWLSRRLENARGKSVLALFHIPALVNETRVHNRAARLHTLLASSPAVRAVVTGHEHGFQHYEPPVFSKFAGLTPGPDAAAPHYFVSGASGAFLSPVEVATNEGDYPASVVFPDRDAWSAYVHRRPLRRWGFSRIAKSALARAVHGLEGAIWDQDDEQFLSLLHVEADKTTGGWRVSLTPYFQQDLDDLYPGVPEGTQVSVGEGLPPPPAAGLAKCRQPSVQLYP
jgi:calcineurin-like phosphoesterase family protein